MKFKIELRAEYEVEADNEKDARRNANDNARDDIIGGADFTYEIKTIPGLFYIFSHYEGEDEKLTKFEIPRAKMEEWKNKIHDHEIAPIHNLNGSYCNVDLDEELTHEGFEEHEEGEDFMLFFDVQSGVQDDCGGHNETFKVKVLIDKDQNFIKFETY